MSNSLVAIIDLAPESPSRSTLSPTRLEPTAAQLLARQRPKMGLPYNLRRTSRYTIMVLFSKSRDESHWSMMQSLVKSVLRTFIAVAEISS